MARDKNKKTNCNIGTLLVAAAFLVLIAPLAVAFLFPMAPCVSAASGTITDFSEWSCDGCVADATGIHLTGPTATFSSNLLTMSDFANTKSIQWTADPGAIVKLQYRDFEDEVVVDTSDPDLLAYWPLNGDYQTSAGGLELAGNGYDGDNFTTGTFEGEQAASFNGSSQYLEFAHSDDYRIGAEGSITAFIKVMPGGTCESGRCEIVNTRHDSQEHGYSLEYRPGNKSLQFRWGSTEAGSSAVGYTALAQRDALDDGMWHMIGVTFDSVNDEIEFYVDGFHVGTATGSFSAITDQSSNLIIGAYQDKQSYFFNGSIAHVAIYDDVRTDSEMENDYYGAFVGGNVPLIYFHDIENEEPGADIDISYDDFTELIDWLDKVGYTTVVAEEVLLWQQGQFTLPPRPINIQFDDGFDGVYSLAYPYMDERGMRGTIALMTSAVGAPGRMTYEQARELREQKIGK